MHVNYTLAWYTEAAKKRVNSKVVGAGNEPKYLLPSVSSRKEMGTIHEVKKIFRPWCIRNCTLTVIHRDLKDKLYSRQNKLLIVLP